MELGVFNYSQDIAYVAVGSQRVAHGEIVNFDAMLVFDSLLVTLSLEFSIRALSSLQTSA
jgi:hypothetical protein